MDNKAIEAAAKVAWDRDERASEVASDWRGSNYKAVPWERASEVDKSEYLSDAQACIDAYLAASGDGEDAALGLQVRQDAAAQPCDLKDFGGCGPVELCLPCDSRRILKNREAARG